MPGWNGWQKAILKEISAPVTEHTLNWLNAWSQTVDSSGRFNPLGARTVVDKSKPHDKTKVQDYPTASAGAVGVFVEFQKPAYGDLLSAIRTGNPFGNIGHHPDAIPGLKRWGVNIAQFDPMISDLENVPQTTPGTKVPAGVAKAWRNVLDFYDVKVPKRHTEAQALAKSYTQLFK